MEESKGDEKKFSTCLQAGKCNADFAFKDHLIFSCYSCKPNLSTKPLTSSSSFPKPQLHHQLGCNSWSQTRHLFYSLRSSPKKKGWQLCLHDVTSMSQQWYPQLQNPHGLTFIIIKFLEVGGQVGCKIGLGQNDKPPPLHILATWLAIAFCVCSKPNIYL